MGPWDYISDLSNITSLLRQGLEGFLADWLVYLIMALIGVITLLVFLVPSLLAVLWIERKLIGRLQIRYGPNRAGRFGLLQPIADAIKILTKEAITPAGIDKWVYLLSPIAAFVPIFMVYAVLPFGPRMIFTDLNIGILYVVAVSSVATITIFMAGWASNNKYSLLSAMRAVAQMVSYEIPLVLSIVGVVIIVGSLSMVDIVEAQTVPFVLLQPLGFIIFFISSVAELNRTPLDIVEAESEIIAGYHIEYSGMKFSLFYIAEYTNALAAGAIIATLFFGGWRGPILPPWLWLIVKVYFFFLVLTWMRGTLPRLRIDQLMGFAWKFLLPLALINIFITGSLVFIWPDSPWLIAIVNIVVAVILVIVWSNLLRLEGFRAWNRRLASLEPGLSTGQGRSSTP